jgi:hypothetical protein
MNFTGRCGQVSAAKGGTKEAAKISNKRSAKLSRYNPRAGRPIADMDQSSVAAAYDIDGLHTRQFS